MKNETGVQFNLDSTWDVFKAFLKRGKGRFFSFLYNRFAWEYYPKLRIIPSFPLNVDIEVCSICNLKCTHCFRQYMKIDDDPFMDMELYKKIIDECAREKLFTLKFSMRGEPLMHPEINEMIDYAKNKGIKEVWINTNGKTLNETMIRRFIQSGLDWLTVSVDGVGENYEKVRIPLKFEDTYEKLKLLRRLRDEARANKPVLKVQTIYSAIQDNPEEYLRTFQPIVDKISFNTDMNFKAIKVVPDPDFVCPRMWQRLAVTASGDILRCPSDFLKEDVLGNVKNQSIKSIWHGPAMTRLRKMNLEGRRLEDIVCAKCHHGCKKVKTVLKHQELERDMNAYVFEKKPVSSAK